MNSTCDQMSWRLDIRKTLDENYKDNEAAKK